MTVSKTFVRIEHKELGKGFLSTSYLMENNVELDYEITHTFSTFPAPYAEEELHIGYATPGDRWSKFNTRFFFGFHRIDQILKLIEMTQLSKMVNLGFRVYEIKVSKHHESPNQVMYDMDDIVEKIDITDRVFQCYLGNMNN